MTRIIAGSLGGRRIQTPKGDGTRPTSDRVREAMFSSLESELGGFDGITVLDVFAGSGALGLESLSRGAVSAMFVESDVRAATVIKRNIADLGVSGSVARTTAEKYVQRHPDIQFDLVYLDPPYAMPPTQLSALVAALLERWVAADALFVVERSSRDTWAWPAGVEPLRDKAYGETHLWYGR